jgi:hypothetical protein
LLFGNGIASRIPYNFFISNLQKGFMEWFYSCGDPSVEKAVGFKLMYGQFHHYQRNWVKEEDISVVHLIRRNALKKHLSALTKKERGWAHSTKKVEPIKVFCNPRTIIRVLDGIVNCQEKYSNWLKNRKSIEIEYESFLYEYPKPYNRILNFLKVKEWSDPNANLIKINPDSIESIIANYDEIYSILKGTRYEIFLE